MKFIKETWIPIVIVILAIPAFSVLAINTVNEGFRIAKNTGIQTINLAGGGSIRINTSNLPDDIFVPTATQQEVQSLANSNVAVSQGITVSIPPADTTPPAISAVTVLDYCKIGTPQNVIEVCATSNENGTMTLDAGLSTNYAGFKSGETAVSSGASTCIRTSSIIAREHRPLPFINVAQAIPMPGTTYYYRIHLLDESKNETVYAGSYKVLAGACPI